MPSHPLHVSCARPTIINKERSKWLIKCKDIYRKFAPKVDDRAVKVIKDHLIHGIRPPLYTVIITLLAN